MFGKETKAVQQNGNVRHNDSVWIGYVYKHDKSRSFQPFTTILHMEDMRYPALFNSNNFAASAALAEVCAPLSVMLVKLIIKDVSRLPITR